jgi:hypothetical protein
MSCFVMRHAAHFQLIPVFYANGHTRVSRLAQTDE